jgi:diguanylate cyclase (GGDEF)-like protein
VSIGIAALEGSEQDLSAFVHKADQALYAAKRGGKNRVEVASLTHAVAPLRPLFTP